MTSKTCFFAHIVYCCNSELVCWSIMVLLQIWKL